MLYKENKLAIWVSILGFSLVLILTGILHMHNIQNKVETTQPELTDEVYNMLFIDHIYLNKKMLKFMEFEYEPAPVFEPFYPLTDAERKVVECLVEGESGNQSLEGRILVAQCIYNAMVQDGLTPSQVRKKYKYVGWSDTPSEQSKEAVSAVFDRGEMGVEDNILWFCTIVSSKKPRSFHATQKLVIEVGNHRFYKPLDV